MAAECAGAELQPQYLSTASGYDSYRKPIMPTVQILKGCNQNAR
jgi:hypothetical protein